MMGYLGAVFLFRQTVPLGMATRESETATDGDTQAG